MQQVKEHGKKNVFSEVQCKKQEWKYLVYGSGSL